MFGTDTLTASHTGTLVSGQRCHVGTHRGNVFNELVERMLILELRATAVRAGTELDLNLLIQMIGLVPEGARMSALAPRPLGRHRAFLWLDTAKGSLGVLGTLGGFGRLLQT